MLNGTDKIKVSNDVLTFLGGICRCGDVRTWGRAGCANSLPGCPGMPKWFMDGIIKMEFDPMYHKLGHSIYDLALGDWLLLSTAYIKSLMVSRINLVEI